MLKPYALPPPPSEAVREKLGTVGVASAGFLPKAEMRKPMGKLSGAARRRSDERFATFPRREPRRRAHAGSLQLGLLRAQLLGTSDGLRPGSGR